MSTRRYTVTFVACKNDKSAATAADAAGFTALACALAFFFSLLPIGVRRRYETDYNHGIW